MKTLSALICLAFFTLQASHVPVDPQALTSEQNSSGCPEYLDMTVNAPGSNSKTTGSPVGSCSHAVVAIKAYQMACPGTVNYSLFEVSDSGSPTSLGGGSVSCESGGSNSVYVNPLKKFRITAYTSGGNGPVYFETNLDFP